MPTKCASENVFSSIVVVVAVVSKGSLTRTVSCLDGEGNKGGATFGVLDAR